MYACYIYAHLYSIRLRFLCKRYLIKTNTTEKEEEKQLILHGFIFPDTGSI
jgi:hypothetical protein